MKDEKEETKIYSRDWWIANGVDPNTIRSPGKEKPNDGTTGTTRERTIETAN